MVLASSLDVNWTRHELPPLVVATTTPESDEVAPTAQQLLRVGHEMLLSLAIRELRVFRGTVSGRACVIQDVPPFDVAMTTPESDDVAPTAQQSLPVGHETPLRLTIRAFWSD